MKEAEQLQRSVCLIRGCGKSRVLLRLLEEFHKLKTVTSKQLTSATNPSEIFLVSVGFLFYFCGYLQSTLQRAYTQRAKHTVNYCRTWRNAFSEEDWRHLPFRYFCILHHLLALPDTFLKEKPSQFSLCLHLFPHMAFKTSRFLDSSLCTSLYTSPCCCETGSY